MRMLSLFSGIGGIDLAAHWAGMQTVAFCEIEPFPQQVLRKHWPNVPIIPDVHDVTRKELTKLGAIDIICGGFPCQPFSHAGARRGAEDERYLWPQVVRVLGEFKPACFVGENVAGLLSMAEPDGGAKVVSRTLSRLPEEDFFEGIYTQSEIMLLDGICQDLENLGYEVQVYVLPAAAVGASNLRERVFLVGFLGYAERSRQRGESRGRSGLEFADGYSGMEGGTLADAKGDIARRLSIGTREADAGSSFGSSSLADSNSEGLSERRYPGLAAAGTETGTRTEPGFERRREIMADANRQRQSQSGRIISQCGRWAVDGSQDVADTECGELEGSRRAGQSINTKTGGRRQTSRYLDDRPRPTQSGLGRGVDVLPAGLDGDINPLDALAAFIEAYPQPALMGQPQHDWEPPRVATGVKHRAARLKALGNAVNPLQIYPILAAIKYIDDMMH